MQKQQNLVLFGAFVVCNNQICLFLHRPVHVSFLGDFWHTIRAHIHVHYLKISDFFDNLIGAGAYELGSRKTSPPRIPFNFEVQIRNKMKYSVATA
jgi:hypothetical protein